ncbi:hypothetical protein DFH11DRAFT_317455 [Phellopilus nigrolimitatus]|nr:hypothetical protein DFH11DRAFT_317455 [Phellopilus nigrolimitatus]
MCLRSSTASSDSCMQYNTRSTGDHKTSPKTRCRSKNHARCTVYRHRLMPSPSISKHGRSFPGFSSLCRMSRIQSVRRPLGPNLGHGRQNIELPRVRACCGCVEVSTAELECYRNSRCDVISRLTLRRSESKFDFRLRHLESVCVVGAFGSLTCEGQKSFPQTSASRFINNEVNLSPVLGDALSESPIGEETRIACKGGSSDESDLMMVMMVAKLFCSFSVAVPYQIW